MNCTHVSEMLPLYITGDLPADKTGPIAGHLRICQDCRSLAAEFAADRDWLQQAAAPAFDEDFYDGLRSGVWNRIDAEAARPKFWQRLLPEWNWRPVTAIAVAVLLLVVFSAIALRRGTNSGLEIDPPQPVAVVNPTPMPTLEPPRPVVIPKKRRPQPKTATPAIPLPVAPENRPALGNIAETTIGGKEIETKEIQMMRIEIQTADPNIKIIWLTPKGD